MPCDKYSIKQYTNIYITHLITCANLPLAPLIIKESHGISPWCMYLCPFTGIWIMDYQLLLHHHMGCNCIAMPCIDLSYKYIMGLNDNVYICQVHSYRQVSNIRRTLAGYKIVDHSHVVGASPVGAAPTTSSFST